MEDKHATYDFNNELEESDEYMKKLHEYWCEAETAAKILGYEDASQVHRLARDGKIVFDTLESGRRLYFKPSLYEYLEKRERLIKEGKWRGMPAGSKLGEKQKKKQVKKP